jgi:hypothetical protein
MSDIDLIRLLNSVGKKVFVDYYAQFSDPSLSTADVAALLPDEYTEHSRRSRASTARRICREGLGDEALYIVAASRSVDPASARKARMLLTGR